MRIVIDMQGAQSESRFRGIGRYVMSWATTLARLAKEHEVVLALNGGFPQTIEPIASAFDGLVPRRNVLVWRGVNPVREMYGDNDWRRLASERMRAAFLRDLAPDFLLIGSFFEGFVDDVSCTIDRDRDALVGAILYDLIPLMNPEKYLANRAFESHYRRKLEDFKRADLFLAISESARQEIIERLEISPEAVVNISAAVDPAFRKLDVPPERAATLLGRLGINKPFVMYTGGSDDRKNLPRLIRAFAALPAEVRDGFQLVLVGRFPPGDHDTLTGEGRSAGLKPSQLLMTGYVPDDSLVDLYNLCTAFVFASWHEGFGLPVLEAMACGAPVICSDTSSLPEVMDRPDARFDPFDETQIRERLHRVLVDQGFRDELSRYGLERAPVFSWEACAQRTLTAVEERLASRGRWSPTRPSWPAILQAVETSQRELIDTIAALPRGPKDAADDDLRRVAAGIHANRNAALAFHRQPWLPEAGIPWRIEGPFDSSYSLALLNRETARALAQMGHQVSLHSTEGPGDFEPDPRFLEANPDLRKMHQRAGGERPDDALVLSRNLYPPRVADLRGQYNLLHHYAWEESGFPAEWVEDFNEHLQGMTCLSRHVEKVMIDHGVTVPLMTSGCGVDHWLRIEPDPGFRPVGKTFRFLHVSSCFPRKGADCLLAAYGSVFSREDDVSLVIKTFPNPHNDIAEQLARARAQRIDFPDVVLIEEDWSDAKLKALYQSCHALVAPSRAEGFGLPLAEAMLSGLPVITTGWGGQLDFCDDETAWLVDYRFAPARTHFELSDSVWAEPDVEDLARRMREVWLSPPEARRTKVDRARDRLMEAFRWRHVAERLVGAVRQLSRSHLPSPRRIGWVSSWNTRCGIADYSRQLIDAMPAEVVVFAARTSVITEPDGSEVARSWNADSLDELHQLELEIEASDVGAVVIQFNYGFYSFEHLSRLIHAQVDAGRAVVVMLHATIDPPQHPDKKLAMLQPAFARCDRLLVHSPADLNRLKDIGLVENVTLFPHGIVDRPAPPPRRDAQGPFRLASYGFFLPHKGLHELVDAVGVLRSSGRDVRLTMVNAEYPVPESARMIEQARQKIGELGLGSSVRLVTDFLPADASLALLEDADLLVFPYQETGESSSAAVRTGLASGRPVAVTPLPIFDDVAPAVLRLPGCSAPELAAGIGDLMDALAGQSEAVRLTCERAAAWRDSHRHSHLGPRLHRILLALMSRRSADKFLGTTELPT